MTSYGKLGGTKHENPTAKPIPIRQNLRYHLQMSELDLTQLVVTLRHAGPSLLQSHLRSGQVKSGSTVEEGTKARASASARVAPSMLHLSPKRGWSAAWLSKSYTSATAVACLASVAPAS